MHRVLLFTGLLALLVTAAAPAQEAPRQEAPRQEAARQAMLAHLDRLAPELAAMNQDIWGFAELGLQERRSSARLADALESAGFRVRRGVSGMPTAFVAE